MTQSDNTQAKIDSSQDKGFHPLMNFLADTFNSEIVDLIDEDFVFEWVGVSDEDEDKKLERQKQELEAGVKTVEMIWRENDIDIEAIKKENGGELPAWAFAPANPQLIQVYMATMQQQQAAEQQKQQEAQTAANQEQEQANSETSHSRQLEIMDKQHTQNLESKQMDQDHQTKLQQTKDSQPQKPADKQQLKKSIEEEFKGLGVTIEWGDY